MKRLLLVPVKTFLYAVKHDMYGILFWYAMAAGAVYAAVSAKSLAKGLTGFTVVGAAYLMVRFLLRKCTWLIGRGRLLERQLRYREKMEGLKKYLFGEE